MDKDKISQSATAIQDGFQYMKNRYGVNVVIPSVSDRTASSTYTQPQQITKHVVRTVETYDEAGRVISKETIEETTYGQSGIVYPQWYQNPVISHTNQSSDTKFVSTVKGVDMGGASFDQPHDVLDMS